MAFLLDKTKKYRAYKKFEPKGPYLFVQSHNLARNLTNISLQRSRHKEFVSPWDSSGDIFNKQAAMIGQPFQLYSHVSNWSIAIHNWVYVLPNFKFSIYVLVFYTLKITRRKT